MTEIPNTEVRTTLDKTSLDTGLDMVQVNLWRTALGAFPLFTLLGLSNVASAPSDNEFWSKALL